jgi:HK97 family phage portal protein
VTGYQYLGTGYAPERIQHLSYLRVPGNVYGVGPIQAAQLDLRGALDTRDFASNWFTDSAVPGGVLSSTQALSPDQAGQYKEQWLKGMSDDSRLAVLGAGLEYKALLLTPEQAQWLASQQFSITQVARMFGIPAGLLLAAVEGSSQTYANVAQAWTELARFTLANYQIEIEQAFSALLPRGTEARLNVEGLLRADTSTRYASYESAIRGGWMTANEVRALEDLAPITGGDVLPTPTTTTKTKGAISA